MSSVIWHKKLASLVSLFAGSCFFNEPMVFLALGGGILSFCCLAFEEGEGGNGVVDAR